MLVYAMLEEGRFSGCRPSFVFFNALLERASPRFQKSTTADASFCAPPRHRYLTCFSKVRYEAMALFVDPRFRQLRHDQAVHKDREWGRILRDMEETLSGTRVGKKEAYTSVKSDFGDH